MFCSLEGRAAIVTGSTGGIGRAISRALNEGGARCLLLGRDDERGRELVGSLADPDRARFERCDVAHAGEIERSIGLAKEIFGGIHILVNNAGITRDNLILRMSEDDWDAVMNVNLKAQYLFTRWCAGMMLRERWGRIINITSVVGLSGNAGQANYAAAKAGIIGLTKSVAKELAGKGITANAIAPGFIETPMTSGLRDEHRAVLKTRIPVGRFGTPEDVANLVRFLSSNEASYINGQVLGVDGGLSV
jgi:3-oxoacyl-[acyl-carrier protein] reductase